MFRSFFVVQSKDFKGVCKDVRNEDKDANRYVP